MSALRNWTAERLVCPRRREVNAAAGKDVLQHTRPSAFTLPPDDFLTGKTIAPCLASQCRQFGHVVSDDRSFTALETMRRRLRFPN
jgi:hypothetical protein